MGKKKKIKRGMDIGEQKGECRGAKKSLGGGGQKKTFWHTLSGGTPRRNKGVIQPK